MGLGGGAEISQYRVRFSRDLLMMNVMFETSVLSVNWRGSAVGLHSRLFGGGVVPNIVTFFL